MTDQTEQDILRGDEAVRLLSNPLLQEAFEVIRQEIHDTWQKSPARDAEGREKLWLMGQMLGRVETHLSSVVNTGKLASATLRQKLTGRATGPF